MDDYKSLAVGLNSYINDAIPYNEDSGYISDNFNDAVKNGGQCRDYVKHKATALVENGVPRNLLGVMFGLLSQGESKVPHSVLTFTPEGYNEPYILDNLTGEVVPLSRHPEYQGFERIPLPKDW